MYMRIVQARAKTGTLPTLQALYNERVIPVLRNVNGCRYAAFMVSTRHADECLSMTLWDEPENALAYEASGRFPQLLDALKPHFSESSELRLQLSEDLTLQFVPVPEDPIVEGYAVAVKEGLETPEPDGTDHLWVRMVSLKLRPGKLEEYKHDYLTRVVPALRGLKGCRSVYLTARPGTSDEVFSVTTWDSLQSAEAYERSGLYESLLDAQEHLLSRLFQWKRSRELSRRDETMTSEDVAIETFDVLASESFHA